MKTFKEFVRESIEISTSNYQFAHGKKPSGRGGWAFEFKINGQWQVEFAPGQMLYTDAKKWAVERAKELKTSMVRVGS